MTKLQEIFADVLLYVSSHVNAVNSVLEALLLQRGISDLREQMHLHEYITIDSITTQIFLNKDLFCTIRTDLEITTTNTGVKHAANTSIDYVQY